MTNLEIANLLRRIAASYTIKDEKKFRFQIIAYQKAADSIEHLTTELEDLYHQNKLNLVPGIGPTLEKHLQELFKKGQVKHFEWVTKGIPKSVFPLLEIPSFGPKKAYKLVNEFSLKNPKTAINDLEKLAKTGKIAKLEGFGEKSEEDILQAINEYKNGKTKTNRMTLPYAYELAQKILEYLNKNKNVVNACSLGSLRRMVSTVGDIDIAVATENPDDVVNYFTSYPLKQRVIEKGPSSATILVAGDKQIDLRVQSPETFGSLLQHFTGSKSHNIHLREYALKKGLSLSEYGIKKGRKLLKFDSEQKFYTALGMQWISPEIREDIGEIERALQHNLPKLIELSDIKGDLHLHSNYPIEPSHDLGQNSMKEMAKKATDLKYEYLAFSEHNPSLLKHTSDQIYTIISRRNEEIEQIMSNNKSIRIIKMLEVDISPSGKLAIDEKTLNLLDGIIVSVHSSFNMGMKQMTERILNGLSHPKAKFLAHPSGRLINERLGYEINYEIIFDFCKKNFKAIEINSYPTRLDLVDIKVREAINNNVKLVISTDSHNLSQMDNMKFGVSVARRGWAEKNDILNTLPYNEFISWLKK